VLYQHIEVKLNQYDYFLKRRRQQVRFTHSFSRRYAVLDHRGKSAEPIAGGWSFSTFSAHSNRSWPHPSFSRGKGFDRDELGIQFALDVSFASVPPRRRIFRSPGPLHGDRYPGEQRKKMAISLRG
jgi:hypothetical protein